jgi:hypothetical protein
LAAETPVTVPHGHMKKQRVHASLQGWAVTIMQESLRFANHSRAESCIAKSEI